MFLEKLKDPTVYATILSVGGAFLVANSTKDIRLLGFLIMVMFIIYLGTSLLGVMNNL